MKERLSETQPTSSPSASSPSRSSTTTRQRLSTPWVAAVWTVAVIAPQCCHGYSLSYRSPDVGLARSSRTANALLLESRSVLPVGLLAPNSNNQDHQLSSIVMSLPEFQMQQQQPPPNMFLHPRRMTSVSSSLTTSSSTSTRPPVLVSPPQNIRIASSDTHSQPRVLGFDISSTLMSSTSTTTSTTTSTALQATRNRKSNVNVETWNGNNNDDLNFFPSPSSSGGGGGLLWNSNVAPNHGLWDDETTSSPTTPTIVLPLWFPWIPTKLQIQELKVTELRQACVQRGLKKACEHSMATTKHVEEDG